MCCEPFVGVYVRPGWICCRCRHYTPWKKPVCHRCGHAACHDGIEPSLGSDVIKKMKTDAKLKFITTEWR